MKDVKPLLQVRKQAKKYQPDFLVKESKFVDRIKSRWRFPQGRHSKVRQFHCGRPAMPNPGYGSPKVVRGLHSSGLKPVLIGTVKELALLDNSREGAILVGTIGRRKKLSLLNFALEHKIRIINVRDPAKLIENINQGMAVRKKVQQEKQQVKTKKQLEKEKKAQEKQKEAEKKSVEEKSGSDAGHDHSVEETVQKQEEQKKQEHLEMEKTITKRV